MGRYATVEILNGCIAILHFIGKINMFFKFLWSQSSIIPGVQSAKNWTFELSLLHLLWFLTNHNQSLLYDSPHPYTIMWNVGLYVWTLPTLCAFLSGINIALYKDLEIWSSICVCTLPLYFNCRFSTNYCMHGNKICAKCNW